MPIVQARPLHRPVADVEAQGPHQMQPAAGGGTGPGDVAGVHGDLRFHKDDIEHGLRRLNPENCRDNTACILLQMRKKFNILRQKGEN